jgi:nucleoside-diphosphate-sugar epimerase
MNDILITGSRGFIGNIVRKTLTRPYDEVDLKLGTDHRDIVGRSGTLIYLSSWVHIDESVKLPVKYLENNLTALAQILTNNSFDKVIFPSSSTVYDGDGNLEPISVYGLTKLAGEKLVKMYCKKCWILRLATPYGPGDERSIFALLARSKEKKETFIIYNGFPIRRDYFHVAHVSWLINMILDGEVEPDIYNVGTGVATDVPRLMTDLCEKYDIDHKFVKAPEGTPPGYIPTTNLLRAPVLNLESEWQKYL